MGDPAGVGPEILLKVLSHPILWRICRPIIFGSAARLAYVQKKVFKKSARFPLPVINLEGRGIEKHPFGVSTAAAGRASGLYIQRAYDFVRRGIAAALVTLPINKKSFALGGWGRKYPGHTEMLAALTGTTDFALMLVAGPLRAIHVTSHIPLRAVAAKITRGRVIKTIQLAHQGLQSFGIGRPRVAVCGLNPHAGDGGRLGWEEEKIIFPAVRACAKKKIHVAGPFSADVVWPLVAGGKFDIGVAMYHDQGQIAVKLAGFRAGKGDLLQPGGVNVTIGLPIIRTSPAHGTAFEIAGQGVASEASLLEAVKTAVFLINNRKNGRV